MRRVFRPFTGLCLIVFSALAHGAAPAASAAVQVFSDRTAFLAATGATDASGPLPDLGPIASGASVGTLVFSLADGGDSLFIGAAGTAAAPDWYPPTPGNDIALGFENVRVDLASGSAHAVGFEMVEPQATMPPYGGTPVSSTYRVTLFGDGEPVGEFTLSDLPKDTVVFVGAWSDQPFEQIEIVDVTDSPFADDDEYFGEFFIGTVAPPQAVLRVTRIGAGSGRVASLPAGIDCGSDCAQSYRVGTVVALTATADAGSTFVGWSGPLDCWDGMVTLSSNVSCTAAFRRSGVCGPFLSGADLAFQPLTPRREPFVLYDLPGLQPYVVAGVFNFGTLASRGTSWRIHLSSDAVLSADDPILGQRVVDPMPPGPPSPVPTDFDDIFLDGLRERVAGNRFYLIAVIDPAGLVVECNEANNIAVRRFQLPCAANPCRPIGR